MGLISTKISDICEFFRNINASHRSNSDSLSIRYTNLLNMTHHQDGLITPKNKNSDKFNDIKSPSTIPGLSTCEDDFKHKFSLKEFHIEQTVYCNKSRNKISNLNSRNFNTYPDSLHNFKNNLNILEKLNKKSTKSKFQDFEILKVLGRGSFGKVLLVKCKKTNNYFAMKVLKKEKLFKTNQISHTKTEKEILEKIDHPFLIKLFYAFQNDIKLYLVTEFMQGGELYFHLKKAKRFPESKAKFYACEIILALEYLHDSNIIYRDLKPENILIDVDGHIKLTDFGLSKFLYVNARKNSNVSSVSVNNFDYIDDRAFTICGTPEYLAPEILIGSGYNKSVDWWSLGILLYEMLTGATPFKYRRERRIDYDIFLKPIDMHGNDTISENVKDLIMSLLKFNPADRLNDPRIIKSHKFFEEINWTFVEKKMYQPEFVPKKYFQALDDLCFFDKKYVEEDSISSDEEIKKRNFINHSDDKFYRKRYRRYNDFENFSFEREEAQETL